MDFPKDRFKLYVRQQDCPASASLLAYKAEHNLPMEVVFLDFKSRLKAIPSIENRLDGAMQVGDEAIALIHKLAKSSSLTPEELEKNFIAYTHPRSPKSNHLLKLIAETSVNITIMDVGFLDHIKGTPTLADVYEKTVYNAEDALASYKDIYAEFHEINQKAQYLSLPKTLRKPGGSTACVDWRPANRPVATEVCFDESQDAFNDGRWQTQNKPNVWFRNFGGGGKEVSDRIQHKSKSAVTSAKSGNSTHQVCQLKLWVETLNVRISKYGREC